MNTQKPHDELQGSFVRWQSITIAQLTYAINLIFGLSIAVFGFQVTLLLNEHFYPVSCWQKLTLSLSLVSLIACIVLGIWLVINRLSDFRITARTARRREEGAKEHELGDLRAQSKRFGKRTWRLFYWQIGTFGCRFLLACLSIIPSVVDKLI